MGNPILKPEGPQRTRGVHAANEQMFDTTSTLYRTDQWFDSSARSSFAYDITRRRLLEHLALDGHESVLEVGCGPGTWTRVMAGLGVRLTAVDISSQMIVRAREFVRPIEVSFHHEDVLHFRPGVRYDRVVSVRAIEYVANLDGLIDRLSDLVADDGRLVLISKTPVSVWRGRRLAGQLFRNRLGRAWKPAAGDQGFYQQRISPWRLVRLLGAAGFERAAIAPVIVGLPILAGVEGDIPLVPRRLAPALLSYFDQLGDTLAAAPQWLTRLNVCLSESYLVAARRRPRTGRSDSHF